MIHQPIVKLQKRINNTHTHTHTHIYIYIYRERERERVITFFESNIKLSKPCYIIE